jgi:hypothetical protein
MTGIGPICTSNGASFLSGPNGTGLMVQDASADASTLRVDLSCVVAVVVALTPVRDHDVLKFPVTGPDTLAATARTPPAPQLSASSSGRARPLAAAEDGELLMETPGKSAAALMDPCGMAWRRVAGTVLSVCLDPSDLTPMTLTRTRQEWLARFRPRGSRPPARAWRPS